MTRLRVSGYLAPRERRQHIPLSRVAEGPAQRRHSNRSLRDAGANSDARLAHERPAKDKDRTLVEPLSHSGEGLFCCRRMRRSTRPTAALAARARPRRRRRRPRRAGRAGARRRRRRHARAGRPRRASRSRTCTASRSTTTRDVGAPKVEAAAARLARGRARRCASRRAARRFDAGRRRARSRGFDVVLDGTDTIAAKFAVNDAAVAARRAARARRRRSASAAQLLTVLPGATACYRCVFEEPPPPDDVPSCQEAGVLGPVRRARRRAPGRRGASALLTGAAPRFADRLLTIDAARRRRWRSVPARAATRAAPPAAPRRASRREKECSFMSYVKGLRCRECGAETPGRPAARLRDRASARSRSSTTTPPSGAC